MKKSFRWFLVGFVALVASMVTLAACHSSSDSGFFGFGSGGVGAKTFSRGTIGSQGTNQQSIDVNGVQFGTRNTNITMNGNTGANSDLRMGQIVTLRGNASGTNGTASTIVFNNDMTGPITSVTGSGTGLISGVTFTLFGQTVIVDGNTLFDSEDFDLTNLQAGSVVEVSGMPDGTGTLLATFINSKPTASDYNVRGIVSNVSGSTFTLTPNENGNPLTVTLGEGATVTRASAGRTGTGGTAGTISGGTGTGTGGTVSGGTGTGGTVSGGTGTGAGTGGTGTSLADGQLVDVKIDPATYTPGSTTITAKSVVIETALLPQEGDRVFLEGFSSNATGTNAGGNNFQIDGITVDPGSNTAPSVGSRVAVHGTFKNGVLKADMIQPATGSTLTIGAISSISGTRVTVTTGGTGTNLGTGGTGTDLGTGGTGTNLGTGGTGTNLGTGGTGTNLGTGGTGTGGTTGTIERVSCPATGTTNVTIRDFSFTPANVTVKANRIVKWTNRGPSAHTVTSTGTAAFDSGTINANSSVCFQFPTAGTFNYFCSIHPTMTGRVTVTGTATGGTGTGGTTGSGTGGTSTAGTTRVTMVVNGTTFDISGAKIKMNGQPATIADLQPGKQVIVKAFSNNFMNILFPGTTTGTGGTTAGGTSGAGAGGTGLGSTGTGTTSGTGGTTGTTSGAGGTGTSYPTAQTTTSGTGGTGTTEDNPSRIGVDDTTGTGTGGIGASGTNAGSSTGAGGSGTLTTTGTNTLTGGTTSGTGTGGTSSRLVVKAVTIWIIDNIHGPATAMSGSLTSSTSGTTNGSLATEPTATFTVFGQTIVVNGTTQFGRVLHTLMSTNTGSLAGLDTAQNPIMEASGIPDNAGDLLATFLETHLTATEYHVRGIVSGATGSPLSTFTLTPVPSGTPLTVSVVSGATVTNVTDGMTVNVRIDPSTFNAGSTSLTAKAVDPVREPLLTDGSLVSVEGLVTGSGTIMTATGMPVNIGSVSTTGLTTGQRVVIKGTVSGGTINASQITVR